VNYYFYFLQLIVVALFAVASANTFQNPWSTARVLKIDDEKPVAILRSASDFKDDGSWRHRYVSI
jgi:hypothetical protein